MGLESQLVMILSFYFVGTRSNGWFNIFIFIFESLKGHSRRPVALPKFSWTIVPDKNVASIFTVVQADELSRTVKGVGLFWVVR